MNEPFERGSDLITGARRRARGYGHASAGTRTADVATRGAESRVERAAAPLAGGPCSRPEQTLFEPRKSRLRPEKNLLELLIEHYDELDRLRAIHDSEHAELASVLGGKDSCDERAHP